MESVQAKTPETPPKRFSRKGSMPLSLRFTIDEIEWIKQEAQKEGISQAKFIRILLDKGLDNQNDQSEKVEKLEKVVSNLLDFYLDLADRGVITDEDAERLDKIQEDL